MQFDEHLSRRDLLTRPRYCPECRKGQTDGAPLCPDCSGTMLDQGYCTICESYWLMPVGGVCPKHDVTFEAGPPKPLVWSPPGESAELVTIARFAMEGEAEAARIRLEAEGIPTFLEGERMGTASMYTVATGGMKLQVPSPLVADARILLSQTWRPPVEDDELDDWEELAPEVGGLRRTIMKELILFLFFAPLVFLILAIVLGY